MLGREAYQNTYILTEIEKHIYHNASLTPSREEVIEAYLEYAKQQTHLGVPLKSMTKHLMGLFHGQSNAKEMRRKIFRVGLIKNSLFIFEKSKEFLATVMQ